MLYLSQILGRPVYDVEGEKMAGIRDIVVRFGENDYPPVVGLVARINRRNFFISRKRLDTLNESGIRLNTDKINLRPFTRREGEVLLAKDVLDKQLIDMDGKRVVRVNDVQFFDTSDEWRVSGADVTFQGFLRRLLPHGFYGSARAVEVIDWADVGYLATGTSAATVQLKSAKGKLSRLHPVEIAQLAESLSPIHRTGIVESLDNEAAADMLEEMSTENQARILEEMDGERAADILEMMSPDDAVDVLGELPEEKAQELFDLMEDEEKADVAELMPYDADTAGGLMTTEFIAFPRQLTVGDAIARLRSMAETPNMIYYFYVVEEETSWRLCGVISLRSLILGDPLMRLEEVMRDNYQAAHPEDSAEEVSQVVADYNLLALPVVDDEGDIVGIVTVDDAMEILLPKNFGKRLPRIFN
jgi:magnesium transporter